MREGMMGRVGASIVLLLALGCAPPEERIAGYRARAEAYFEEGRWSEAKIENLNLLQLDPEDAPAHYQIANSQWALKEYGDAIWQFREAARLDPENTEYRMRLAAVLFLARDHGGVSDQVARVLEHDPGHVPALILRARVEALKGEPEVSLETLNGALTLDPNQAGALAMKAQLLAVRGDSAEAESVLKDLVRIESSVKTRLLYGAFLAGEERPEDALVQLRAAVDALGTQDEVSRARVILTNFHLNRGDYEAAEATLLEAREASPDNQQVLLTLAQFYALRGQSEQAESMLEERAQKRPTEVIPVLVLADFYRRTGQSEKALEAIERALAIDPDSDQALLRKAEYLLAIDAEDADEVNTTEARALIRQVLDANPSSLRGLFTEAKLMIIEKQYDEAATRLRSVIEEQPTANAHVLLGTTYLRIEQHELARAEFQKALRLDANHHLARAQLARLYLMMGDRTLAAREAQGVLERWPGDREMMLLRAQALTGLNDRKEALEILSAIRFDEETGPRFKLRVASLYRTNQDLERSREILEEISSTYDAPLLIWELAQLDRMEGNPQLAIRRLDDAIALSPAVENLYFYRGTMQMVLHQTGDPGAAAHAERDFKTVLEKDIGRSDAHAALAALYRMTDRWSEAIERYHSALQIDTTNATLYLSLGTLLELAGRTEDAMEAYGDAIRLDSELAVAKNNLAWLIANSEEPRPEELDRAMALAQDAKTLLPQNPSVADTLGWVMYRKGLPSAAISLFREAIGGYPEDPHLRALVRYHLAQTYRKNGEPDRAIAELRRALAESPDFRDRPAAEELLKKLQSS